MVNGSSCLTDATGTCSLTVTSTTAGSAPVSATATPFPLELPDYSVTTDGQGENSPPAIVNWGGVKIQITATGGDIDEVGYIRDHSVRVQVNDGGGWENAEGAEAFKGNR